MEGASALDKVLVVGGGVAGITAALDLADQGHTVYLVEREPSIGGRMAQLDKTFPTLDCSICILAPKMVEISRHPNVRLMTYSELNDVKPILDGKAFRVRIRQKPRYVDEDKCTGCRLCMEKCPVKIPSEFDEKLGTQKAICIPFPQAVPAIATINEENCLFFQKGVCKVCERFCPSKAVDFEQKGKEATVEVSSIVVATGFDLLDTSTLSQFGFGRFLDVLTSIQYERLMNAAGPMGGQILRLSNKEEPKKVSFIQCVGSRNVDVKPYCSQICCSYATKEAIVTKEHNPEIDVTVFQNDLRAPGKGHEELTTRAGEEFGIKYVRSLPNKVSYDPTTGKLEVSYMETPSGTTKTMESDLIVLCPAVIPKQGTGDLARTLGLNLSEHGFLASLGEATPVDTNVPGIYVCGACEGPKDISSSVAQASAAAARATLRTEIHRARPRKTEVKSRTTSTEPRIGVFACHCGVNIGGVIDIPELVSYAKKLENVAHAEEFLFACSKDAAAKIKEAIETHDLNRVIVASCTPRTHESLFRATCEEAGLNPYLFEMVNIREHDSWVHTHNPEEATRKAKDLLRMAAVKAKLLHPLQKLESEVNKTAMVIGGGLAGLLAANTIADKGFNTYLIDDGKNSGSKTLRTPFENDVKPMLDSLKGQVQNHKRIELLTPARLKDVKGSLGNFEVTLLQGEEQKTVKAGTIIVAADAATLDPIGLYGYGEHDGVLTLEQFGCMIEDNEVAEDNNIVMILCAGAREAEGRTYCSATCCSETIDLAMKAKQANPDCEIYILYRDIVVSWKDEIHYREAREKGIIFARFEQSQPPEIENRDDSLAVKVTETVTGSKLLIPADKIVLATPSVPTEHMKELSSILKVSRTTQGFFLEAHPKLRPLDFATDGIHLCGTCHSPQGLSETVSQALGAASRALIPLMRGTIINEPAVAEVNSDKCIACTNCEAVCEYGAVKVKNVAEVNPFLCKGCGVCAVECPAQAIIMHHFTDEQLSAMIKAALETLPNEGRPKALAFFCNWCSYAGADMAGVSRFQYPPSTRIIRVMCTGRIDQQHILQAFLQGADGVLIGGCHPGDCHYISGNLKAEKRIQQLKEWMKEAGIEPERLRIEWASAGEGKRISEIMKSFTEQLQKLGPNPLAKQPQIKQKT